MNPSLQEVTSFINEGKIKEAKEFLHKILFQEKEKEILMEALPLNLVLFFNEKKIKEAHDFLFQFFTELKKNNEAETLLTLSELIKKDHYSFKYHQSLFLQFEAWAHFTLGRVQSSQVTYLALVKLYDQKKQVDLQEKLLEEILGIFPREAVFHYFKVRNIVHQGKSTEFKNALSKYLSYENKSQKLSLLERIKEQIFLEWDDPKLQMEFLDVILCQPVKSKKELIKLVNASINHAGAFFFFQLSIFFNHLSKFTLAQEIHTFALKAYRKDYKPLMKANPIITNKIETGKKVSELLGLDDLNHADLSEEKLERLSLKVKFAKKYGSDKELLRLESLVQAIDPFYVSDEGITEEMIKSSQSKVPGRFFDNQIIFEELLSQISYYSQAKNEDEDKIRELKFELSKIIEFSLEELSENRLTDYIVMLHSFKFHDLALEMISKFKQQNPQYEKDIKLFLEIAYLEVSVNQELKKYYDNLNLLSAINTGLPLSKEEKICFLYLEAETLHLLGRDKDALFIFKKIDQLEPGYRLSKIRIRQIEKS